MKPPFTFPAALEPFIAYQERLINRPLSAGEREVTAVWLEIINRAEPGDEKIIDQLIAQHPDNDRINLFLEAVKAWMEVAWKHGMNC